MEKRYGSSVRQDGVWRIGRKRWAVFYGYGEEGEWGYNYYMELTHKPTLEEIKAAVIDCVNASVDEAILSGFVWNGHSIWLSMENQFNYKAAYDLALQTSGASLPVTFKFGSGSDEQSVYYTFSDVDELTDFYTSAIAYIQSCLAAGWQEKEGIDWAPYETVQEME